MFGARAILHVDMDCFYVSVERLLNPALEGKCVAVGGPESGRGVVSSASYEARKFGVRAAMPTGQAMRLCPQLILVVGSYSRYGEFSQHIERIMGDFTPLVQMASQDEAYLDLTGTDRLWGTAVRAAEALRGRILAEVKLPASLGLSTNKLVAKVASSVCKPRALLCVPVGSEASFLAPMEVGALPGVGPKTAEALQRLGIATIGQLADLDPVRAAQQFGVNGADLVARAQGRSESVVVVETPPKSVGHEETFQRDTADAGVLDAAMAGQAERVASRLRAGNFHASVVTLKFRYADFETHTASMTLAVAADDDREILDAARELLRAKVLRGRALRLIGISASGLLQLPVQLDLLAEAMHEKSRKINRAVDALREKYGFDALRRGSSSGEK